MIARHKPFLGRPIGRPAWRKYGGQPVGASERVAGPLQGARDVRCYLDAQISHLVMTLYMIDADIRYTMPVLADAILQRGAKRHRREL